MRSLMLTLRYSIKPVEKAHCSFFHRRVYFSSTSPRKGTGLWKTAISGACSTNLRDLETQGVEQLRSENAMVDCASQPPSPCCSGFYLSALRNMEKPLYTGIVRQRMQQGAFYEIDLFALRRVPCGFCLEVCGLDPNVKNPGHNVTLLSESVPSLEEKNLTGRRIFGHWSDIFPTGMRLSITGSFNMTPVERYRALFLFKRPSLCVGTEVTFRIVHEKENVSSFRAVCIQEVTKR